MAPVNSRSLQRRDNTGISIAIILGVVTVLVLLGILIWGILLPKLRKKKPVQYSEDYLLHLRERRNNPHFPSHPTLLRSIVKKPKKSVPRYDPRTESPFPSRPTPLRTFGYVPIPSPYSQTYLVDQSVNGSDGLFTPARVPLPPRCGVDSGYSEVYWKNKDIPNQKTATGLNGLHEYILPVPEPIHLKPRPAGRPPPLTRQLEKFPLPAPGLSRKGGLIHPGKLLQELEQRDCRLTAAKMFNTRCPKRGTTGGPLSTEAPSLGTPHGHPFTEDLHQAQGNTEELMTLSRTGEPMYERSHQSNEERKFLSHYAGMNARNQGSLSRSAPLTRPETPVADIRQRLDQTASNEDSQVCLPKRGWTPASNPFTTSGHSSTPQTSPVASIPSPPTLTSQFEAADHMGDRPTANPGLRSRRRTPSSSALPSPTKLVSSQQLEHSTAINRLSKKLSPANVFGKRMNPIRTLDVMPVTKKRDLMPRQSASSLSTVFKPMLGGTQSKQSHYASSTYSRETRGMSSAGSPGLGGMFPDSNHLTVPNHRTDALVDKQKHGRSGSMDDLKSKIDEWDLHTGYLDASSFNLVPPPLKRTFSDFGPRRSPAFDASRNFMSSEDVQETRSTISPTIRPKIRIEQWDDDVWDNDMTLVRNSGFGSTSQGQDTTRQVSSGQTREDSPLPVPGTGPGGSDWI
ncbi:hypothetical protein H2204_013696 [Knufia peltigerae]|uniref:Uncharacterized protein n=1 Tax=Knufia peltigerae TaxID=1002370 RepID=A0AA38XQA5_9EURO|nr:hypothetical protein H2204_013696 [Knufia peltigerae]